MNMGKLSALKRGTLLDRMSMNHYDLLIIGGGITGAGIALDAATRSLKTALVEMDDFASGTSSRSTKLIHGGLRYMKNGQFKQVAQLGRERSIVYTNGLHVTSPRWMLLPIYNDSSLGPLMTSFGLKLYDYLAKVKKSEKRIMLSTAETYEREPLLQKKGLLGGGLYVEYVTDDARLTIETIKAAVEQGAHIVNYAKAQSFIYDNSGKIKGVNVQDRINERHYEVKADTIVNATGPWIDGLRSKDEIDGIGNKTIKHSKGVHIVFDQSIFPLQQALYFEATDRRMIFVIPRSGKTYVGTTDTFYNGDPRNPKVLQSDVDYLLRAIREKFPTVQITNQHVESSWVGLRPLIYEKGKASTHISRKDEIWHSPSGLVTIAGGKLTGYRKMAEKVVSQVIKRLNKEGKAYRSASITKQVQISGGHFSSTNHMNEFIKEKGKAALAYGLTEQQGRQLASLYGTNVEQLYAYAKEADGSLPRKQYAQLMYSIHHELTVTLTDFFIRRTGALYFNIKNVRKMKKIVALKMASLLQWTAEERKIYMDELDRALFHATHFK